MDFNVKFKNLKKFIKSRELIFIKNSLDSRVLSHVESNNCLLREKIFFVRLRPIIDIYAAIIDDAATGSEGAVIVASIIEVNR